MDTEIKHIGISVLPAPEDDEVGGYVEIRRCNRMGDLVSHEETTVLPHKPLLGVAAIISSELRKHPGTTSLEVEAEV